MQNAIDMVHEFHKKQGFVKRQFKEIDYWHQVQSSHLAVIARQALTYFEHNDDPRFLRTHLILEETAELLEAMGRGDELLLLDALADLIYVILGTAIMFDLPLAEAFVEVHKSNMTKKVRTDSRCRDKGDWSLPDLKTILERHRCKQ